ncbi:amino acid/amide ABC transporter substrate-binding protein, HAAT family [Natronincola peptidivorans]|uniref:Amino acid/amide ABC transporter substrate-binding protein, HAAT family n=1 Tax=Natronincola peptidivorans TaxID=426128 RepID=A0A1H9ZVF0_9FIRM|nr:ABC transporter substrate-binding protein [Natronincola peptidivorans]SES85751.1 amino acid/amide ABC transporter substrate-binding protein, HAAT family [Natronincola peptidivorans]
MKKWLSILMIMLLVLSLGLTGCSSPAEAPAPAEDEEEVAPVDEDVIRIGVFQPLTGANAAGGALEVEGSRLANELYPEVLGKKIELVVVDNRSDAVEAASAVARLIERDNVVAIIGSWGSTFSMAAGDLVRDNQIPTVAASATNPMVTLDNDYYFRVCFLDPFQGTVMANYAYNGLGARTAGIIREVSNDYAVGLARFFEQAFIELTGDDNAIVEISDYNTGDQDFSSQLLNVSGKNPDVIFAPGNFTESALVIQQARNLGIDIPFIGGDTWETPEFIEIGGDAVEGAVFSTFFTSDVAITKESETFLTAYREQYGKEPAAVTALGYDAYILIRDAIERAGEVDSNKIRDEIAKTQGFEGAAGAINLDENGDPVKSAVIKVVENGEFVYLDTIQPF